MSHLSNLERRLAELRERAAARASQDRLENEGQMNRMAPLRARFEAARESWMGEVVLPRLRALARALPHGGQVEHRPGAIDACMKVGWNRETGFSASLTVSIAPDRGFEGAIIHVLPLFIPILAGNPPAASGDLEVGDWTEESVAGLLDDGIVSFAEAYFEATEPTSPYQRGLFSIDPVCGMAVHHASAAAVLEHEDRRYYFCAVQCADRFRADPDRHAHTSPEKMGGRS